MASSVLIIAPHPDDETIGCGGTICLRQAQGDEVHVVFLTSGELGLKELPREQAWRVREAEAEAAAGVLGVTSLSFLRGPDWFLQERIVEMVGTLRPLLVRLAPACIYVPHAAEWHPDHRAALAISQAALHGVRELQPTMLGYEVWTPLAESDEVEDISAIMRRKLRALRCYRSQLQEFHYDRAVRGLNQYRGALQGKCRYAEVFQSLPALAMAPSTQQVAGAAS